MDISSHAVAFMELVIHLSLGRRRNMSSLKATAWGACWVWNWKLGTVCFTAHWPFTSSYTTHARRTPANYLKKLSNQLSITCAYYLHRPTVLWHSCYRVYSHLILFHALMIACLYIDHPCAGQNQVHQSQPVQAKHGRKIQCYARLDHKIPARNWRKIHFTELNNITKKEEKQWTTQIKGRLFG